MATSIGDLDEVVGGTESIGNEKNDAEGDMGDDDENQEEDADRLGDDDDSYEEEEVNCEDGR